MSIQPIGLAGQEEILWKAGSCWPVS